LEREESGSLWLWGREESGSLSLWEREDSGSLSLWERVRVRAGAHLGPDH